MFGLHWGFVPIALNNYATLGYDVVMMAGLATPVAMAGVTLAIFLKQKQKIKRNRISCFSFSTFGITEPALYGVTLPRKKLLYYLICGSRRWWDHGDFNTKVYINGGTGVFALPRFIHPENGIDNSFIGFALASLVAFVLGFAITFFYAYNSKTEDVEEQPETEAPAPLINNEVGQTVLYDLSAPLKARSFRYQQWKMKLLQVDC